MTKGVKGVLTGPGGRRTTTGREETRGIGEDHVPVVVGVTIKGRGKTEGKGYCLSQDTRKKRKGN